MLPKFSSKAFLAPMAGVSDPALRLQCKKMGAGLVVTEFTNIHSIIAQEKQLKENQKTIKEFIEFSEYERPLSVQLFGSDLKVLEKAAKIVEPFFDIIDYNMGCPAPHITQQMAGGALLQEIDLTRQIFTTLVKAVKKPVTLKFRLGVTDAKMFDQTNCDYVMIGRGAMGNPFLFEQINDYLKTGSYKQYSFKDRLDSFFEYLYLTKQFKIKFVHIKGQAMRFTKGMSGGSKLRSKITLAKNIDELEKIIKDANNQ